MSPPQGANQSPSRWGEGVGIALTCGASSRRLHHAAQHILQNPAMAEIFELIERVDAAEQRHRVDLAIRAMDAAGQLDARLQARGDAENVEPLAAVELQALAIGAVLELERQYAHADEVRAVDALEALGDDGAHAEEPRALGRPIARRAGAVFLAGDDDERDA